MLGDLLNLIVDRSRINLLIFAALHAFFWGYVRHLYFQHQTAPEVKPVPTPETTNHDNPFFGA